MKNKRQKLLVIAIGLVVAIGGGVFFLQSQNVPMADGHAAPVVMFRPKAHGTTATGLTTLHRSASPGATNAMVPSQPAAQPVARSEIAPPHATSSAPVGPGVGPVHANTVGGLAQSPAAPMGGMLVAQRPHTGMANAMFLAAYSQMAREQRLLQMEVKNAELRHKLAALTDSPTAEPTAAPPVVRVGTGSTTAASQPATPKTTTVSAVSIPAVPAPPPVQLAAVMGIGHHYSAVLSVHGIKQMVQVGDRVDGDWKVTGIWPRHVVLSRGRTTRTVSLGD